MQRSILLSLSLVGLIASAQACTVTTVSGSDDGGADGGASSSGGSVGDGGSMGGGCDFAEPNQTRDNPFAIATGTYRGICLEQGSDDFLDWYQYTSPADAAGGYVTVDLGNVQGTDTNIYVFDAETNEQFSSHNASKGESLKIWFAARPSHKYNIVVGHYVENTLGTYDMTIGYTKVDDAFEPNQTREQAAAVPASGTLDAFYTSTPGAGETNSQVDWYKVDFAGGYLDVAVSNVPTNGDGSMVLYDSSFVEVPSKNTGGGDGANFKNVSFDAVAAGTYYIKLDRYVKAVPFEGSGAPADHLTRKYKLTVSAGVMP